MADEIVAGVFQSYDSCEQVAAQHAELHNCERYRAMILNPRNLGMRSSIIVDSPERMVSSPEHQARVAEIRKMIELQFADEHNAAGIIRRWLIRRKIEAAIACERRKIEPSDQAL